MKKPCSECPYRKNSIKGWLGESSGDPMDFLAQLQNPDLHPCHKTIDWEKDDDIEKSDAPKCVGALQFMNNSLQISRYPEIAKLQKTVGKNLDEVMHHKKEFIEHHKL